MKVRDYIKFLMDFNMDAEVVVSTGDTFDDYTEMDISWGGPNSSDGNSKIDAKYIYINNFTTEKKEFKDLHKSKQNRIIDKFRNFLRDKRKHYKYHF